MAQRSTSEKERSEKPNEKVKVLLETRGEGGYFLVQPSNGYKIIQGKLSDIPTISEDERDYLLELARTFNELVDEQREPNEVKAKQSYYIVSPFEDYNNKCDVPSLLESYGWKTARVRGNKYLMQRPNGETPWSAEYDKDKNWFTVFSTSTEFEVLKAHKPYAIFAVLNGLKDWSDVNKKLIEMGYGIKNPQFENSDTKKIFKPEHGNKFNEIFNFDSGFEDDGDISFLSSWSDIRNKQEDFVSGRISMGLTTGYTDLDKHFLFKRGNLVMVNGFDNVGKTTIVLWFAVISAMLHGWKWVIYSAENSDLNIMNILTQFILNKQLKITTEEERNEAQAFIEKFFFHIKPEELLNYGELKTKLLKVHSYVKVDAVLIDPYNSLDVTKSANTHDFNYAVLTDMKIWGRKEDVSIWVNNHAVTSALRNKDENGYLKAPDKGDTEGGAKFANKADDWITFHRIANHESEDIRRITEVHIRKIKDTMTGGSQTSKDSPILLTWSNYGSCYLNSERKHPFINLIDKVDYEDVINHNVPF